MQIYTVSELADYVKSVLEHDPQLSDIWVSGEVSSVFVSGAGHRYFTFKDLGGQLKAVLFRGNHGVEHVANGAQVNLHGRVSYYVTRGDVQLYVDAIVPVGTGVLAAEFELLRNKLDKEGLFDPSRKRSLPDFPQRIGVVTSAEGAVIHDITRVLRSRFPLAELVLCAASVQGAEAPSEIAEAIGVINAESGIDVLIVARGGGSMEDLWAFNTEAVARAIYGSTVPIVSAVGHESDFTIADYVADLRAPTPSAAASAVTPDVASLTQEILALARRTDNSMTQSFTQLAHLVEDMISQMRGHLPDIPAQRQRTDDILERARVALGAFMRIKREQTNSLQQALSALNPMAVLDRGFAVVTAASSNETINSTAQVHKGDILVTTVRDGYFETEVQ